MNLVKEIGAELVGMFVGDARLALAVAATIALAAGAAASGLPLLAGAVLLLGSLSALIENVCRSARR